MEAIRKIIDLDSIKGLIDIPPTFCHKKVEILILPVENMETEKLKTFSPENFYGVSKIKDIENNIKNMRDEWD